MLSEFRQTVLKSIKHMSGGMGRWRAPIWQGGFSGCGLDAVHGICCKGMNGIKVDDQAVVSVVHLLSTVPVTE